MTQGIDSLERKRASSRKYARKKLASDPEFREKLYARNKEYVKNNRKKVSRYHTEWQRKHKLKINLQRKIKRANSPEKNILDNARKRAKRLNLPFNINLSDIIIPSVCPALGIPLIFGNKSSQNQASIDRIIPSLGYVKGNVKIISRRANTIKNNATATELRLITEWLEREINGIS